MKPSRALLRSEAKIIRNDPTTPALLFVAPLLLIALLHNVYTPIGDGMASPAYAVLFAFMLSTWVIYSFFKEFGWSTWPRLRASGLSVATLVRAKLVPYVVLGAVQQVLVVAVGLVAVGEADEVASIPSMIPVSFAFVIVTVTFGFLLAATSRNHMQASTLANLVAFVFAAIGGAIAPVELLPGWAQAVSLISPHRWALEGFEAALAGNAREAVVWSLPLLALAVVFFLVASWRFDESDDKEFAY